MTNAVLTNTHAVSPEFTADAADAGVAATAAVTVVAASSAMAGNAPTSAIPVPISPVINPSLFTYPPLSLVVTCNNFSITPGMFNTMFRAKWLSIRLAMLVSC